MPHLWFALISRIIAIMSPPLFIDMPGVLLSVVLVCASAGADVLNTPPKIAKAVTSTATAVRVVFIKQGENTIDLKEYGKVSLSPSSSIFISGFLALCSILLLATAI